MRLCVILALLTWGLAAAAEPQPILSVAAGNLARTRQRLETSIYGDIWNHPVLAEVRTMVEAQSAAAAAEEGGVNPLEVARGIGQISFAINGILPDQQPPLAFRLQLELGAQTEAVWKLMAKEAEKTDGDVLVLGDQVRAKRTGTRLVFANDAAQLVWQEIPASEADVVIGFDGERLLAELGKLEGQITADDLAKIRRLGVGSGNLHVQVTPTGIQEKGRFKNRALGMASANLGQLARLPGNCLTSLSFGLAGAEVWKNVAPLLLEHLAKAQDSSVAEIQAQTDAELKAFGIPLSIEQLVSGLTGPLTLAATPGMPFPAPVLITPRGPVWDALVGALLAKVKAQMPAEGGRTVCMIPDLPMAFHVGRMADAWVISGNPAALDSQATGWKDGIAVKAGLAAAATDKDLLAFGASDTAALLRMSSGYLLLGGMFFKDLGAERLQQINDLVQKLAQKVQPGYVVVKRLGPEEIDYRCQGLLGGTVAFYGGAIGGAIAIPYVMMRQAMAGMVEDDGLIIEDDGTAKPKAETQPEEQKPGARVEP